MDVAELKSFRRKLVKAGKEAVKLYPSQWCIHDALDRNGIALGVTYGDDDAVFDLNGNYESCSAMWIREHASTVEHVAAVFANSIAAIDARIASLSARSRSQNK